MMDDLAALHQQLAVMAERHMLKEGPEALGDLAVNSVAMQMMQLAAKEAIQ